MPTVFANGRSILHAGDGLQHASALPDVCKTPSPGGPVPVPYVNVASDGDLAKGTKRVKIGGKSVALASSHLSTSVGDEPGTAGGGLASSKTKGKMTWGSASADVKFEGKGVVRFGDVTQHNGNSFNAAFTAMGGTGLAYADDFEGPCPICKHGPEPHRVLEADLVAEKTAKLIAELHRMFDRATDDAGRARVARPRGDGNWGGYMVGVMSCKCAKPQYFCTNSGDTVPGLAEAAARVGGFAGVIGGGGATQANFIAACQAPTSPAQKTKAIREAFRLTDMARAAKKQGYNKPGSCAGAKLLAKCTHGPRFMCEVFFAPRGTTWLQSYKVLTTDEAAGKVTPKRLGHRPQWVIDILANARAVKTARSFVAGEPVASCHTCQKTVYMTMCPERVCR
jgi:hypothetical protein